MMFQPQRVNQLRVTIEGIEYSFHEGLDGRIMGTVVKYPSCQATGVTLEEALDATQETLIALLEELREMGMPIPDDLQAFYNARIKNG